MSVKMASEQEKHYQLSVERIAKMREQEISPYPHRFDRDTHPTEFIKRSSSLEPDTCMKDTVVKMAGRVMQKRDAGKLVFYTVVFDRIPVQVMCLLDRSGLEKPEFKEKHRRVKRGDVVGVTGHPGKSKTGEISVYATDVQVLAPCMHMLPSEHFGLKDTATRYSNRPLDGIMNPEVNRMLKTRSITVQSLREFLLKRGFIEVSTPILWHQPGGANAKTFKTHYNSIDSDVHLRVAPELFLKQLVIGGSERVFEIGRQFRNEEMDLTHNPEFETLEFYEAYADYNDLMRTTEEMLRETVYRATGSLTVTLENGTEIDFEKPFRVVKIVPTLEEALGEKLDLTSDFEPKLEQLLKKHEIECGVKTVAKMLDKLIGHFIEPGCQQPTFLIDHPLVMSPLAKWHRDDPNLTERFELFVAGMEIVNAYTELNDPRQQERSFAGQEKDRGRDEEAMTTNTKFVRALEYGLPPTAGFGLGIDRLVMLLTGNSSIHEVLAFPIRRA